MQSPPQAGSLRHRELLLVAALLVLGTGLRVAFPSHIAVEHFDEGVYASNIWFGAELGYQYPKRRFYAPPLLPNLIEWSIIFDQLTHAAQHKISSLAPMAPSLVAGCLTLLVVWKTAGEWFGPSAGLAALSLAALSDFHALYSRTALTEALMLLFFVAAVWALKRALSTSSYLFLGLAGLFTGLGWWTKYNGWLPLAVGLGGLVLALVVDSSSRRHAVRRIGYWTGAAAIAFAVWSPYLSELQSYGGYAEIAANHRQYIVGFGGWGASLSRQYANLSHFEGWAACASVGLAVMLAATLAHLDRQRLLHCFSLAIALCAASVWLGAALVMFLLAVWFVGTDLYRRWTKPDDCERPGELLAVCFVAAWIAGLFLVTPLYHAYPRLLLPWLSGVWIGAGFAVRQLVGARCQGNRDQAGTRHWIAVLAIGTLALLAGLPRVAAHGWPAWQSRTGWISIAEQIVTKVGNRAESARGNRAEAIVIVYGEPGLFFHLSAEGSQVFVPAADLSSIDQPLRDPSIPMFLVSGPHAQRTPGFEEEIVQHASRLARIAEFDYAASDLVLLNQYDARVLKTPAGIPSLQRVTLYEVISESE